MKEMRSSGFSHALMQPKGSGSQSRVNFEMVLRELDVLAAKITLKDTVKRFKILQALVDAKFTEFNVRKTFRVTAMKHLLGETPYKFSVLNDDFSVKIGE